MGYRQGIKIQNRLRRQLIENERLPAIGQTVAGLAHCIKNILNGLKGGTYLINVGLKRKENGLVDEGWQTVLGKGSAFTLLLPVQLSDSSDFLT